MWKSSLYSRPFYCMTYSGAVLFINFGLLLFVASIQQKGGVTQEVGALWVHMLYSLVNITTARHYYIIISPYFNYKRLFMN